MAIEHHQQVHTQKPTNVEVLVGGDVVALAQAGFRVLLDYADEVPDVSDWHGQFHEPWGDLAPTALAGRGDVTIRLPTTGLTGRIAVDGAGTFTGIGPAPVEIPTK